MIIFAISVYFLEDVLQIIRAYRARCLNQVLHFGIAGPEDLLNSSDIVLSQIVIYYICDQLEFFVVERKL